MDVPPETWSVSKPAIASRGGVVVSQHHVASRVGADVLAAGGNAVDAAVAAGLAIGAVEPWMSGLGGCGYMVVFLARENRSYAIEFGVRAPLGLDPADYPVVEGIGPDLFSWPAVLENRNISGRFSIAVPGMTAGMALALETFGTRSWEQTLQPAIDIADGGMAVDWYATLKIASAARDLDQFDESRRIFLPGGHVPVGEWGGAVPRITLARLPQTLRRLAAAGPRDFYCGAIAEDIVADAGELGIGLAMDDLAQYEAHLTPVESVRYRGARADIVPGLTAGPTLHYALRALEQRLAPGIEPDAAAYESYVGCLIEAYAHRLARVGDVPETAAMSCTTHLGVADRHGNVVALTQTLLSLFGSKVTLPRTGILMNNGIMWFDPRPGHPNSIQAGKRPLSNMCPVVLHRGDGVRFALGAAGGRRIMPAVFQLISFLVDYRLSVDAAMTQPRVDVSGTERVTADKRLPAAVLEALAAHRPLVVGRGVYPNLFACPNVAAYDPASATTTGGAFIMSPWASACAEPGAAGGGD